MNWITAFLLTQIFEVPTGLILWRRFQIPLTKKIVILFLASTLTHPILWFVFPKIISTQNYFLFVTAGELWVIVFEAFWFKRFDFPNPLRNSVLINLVSTILGLILHRSLHVF